MTFCVIVIICKVGHMNVLSSKYFGEEIFVPSTFAKEAGNAIKLLVVTLILIIINNNNE